MELFLKNRYCIISFRGFMPVVNVQQDLRDDLHTISTLAARGQTMVDEVAARKIAGELGAVAYIECSALTQV